MTQQVKGVDGIEVVRDRVVEVEGRERRVVRINGETARNQAALAEQMAAVWLTPRMDRLFTEGGSGRRRRAP